MPTSVLLSGAKGFIGSRLTRALEAADIGWQDAGDVLRPIRFREKPSVVIHLAAVSSARDFSANLSRAYSVNVQGTLNMLDAAHRAGARFVLASSSAVYGSTPRRRVSESAPARPLNPYGNSKLIAETLCETFAREYGMPALALRFFNIYGPGQRDEFLIPYLVRGVLKGVPLSLRHPDAERDFLHIDDVCALLVRLVRRAHRGFHVFNVGTGTARSVRSILAEVERLTGRRAEWDRASNGKRREAERVVADIRRVSRFAKWKPRVPLERGLEGVIDEHH
jgi:UDP-glucose 4-epimerase